MHQPTALTFFFSLRPEIQSHIWTISKNFSLFSISFLKKNNSNHMLHNFKWYKIQCIYLSISKHSSNKVLIGKWKFQYEVWCMQWYESIGRKIFYLIQVQGPVGLRCWRLLLLFDLSMLYLKRETSLLSSRIQLHNLKYKS